MTTNFKKGSAEHADLSQLWNKAVGLRRPIVGTFKAELGLNKTPPVFDSPANIFSITPNLVFLLPSRETFSGDTPVLSILLAVIGDFFKSPSVMSKELVGFSFLGRNLPCSAATMLDHLKNADAAQISSLGSTANELEIEYGKALKLTFEPLPSASKITPEESRLVSIECFYTIPYTGKLSLLI